MKKTIILIVIIIVVITLIIALIFDWGRTDNKLPDVGANLAMTEDKSQNSSDMPIIVNNIKDNQEVSNPIKIEGKAKGFWFFEGSFPIQLVDTNENILASTVGKAQGDWMTDDFVKFTANIEYKKASSTKYGFIVLNKDNPSGNPDFDQSVFIPVILK